jgi:predicted RNase H-like HicB family nuclease
MSKGSIIVRAQWDPEARVWVATSEDVPGLVTEAETSEALFAKLDIMIPELLAGTAAMDDFLPEVPVVVMSEHVSRLRLRAH